MLLCKGNCAFFVSIFFRPSSTLALIHAYSSKTLSFLKGLFTMVSIFNRLTRKIKEIHRKIFKREKKEEKEEEKEKS